MTITRTNWTIVKDVAARDAALDLARGDYQRDFINGYENLSGSTLAGRARGYAARYARSRDALLRRLTAAGIAWTEEKGPHGARLLVIGE